MEKKEIAVKIIAALGGKQNIANYTHCVTRLRFNLVNDTLAHMEELEDCEGILGVTMQGGQYQIIIGTNVEEYYKEIVLLVSDAVQNTKKAETKETFRVMRLLDVLTSIIAPVIPAFCASGMLKCICLLLTTSGILTGSEGIYIMLDFMSDVAFYFLPILIAMSSAKRFKVDQGLAICVAGALLYPSFVSMVNEGVALQLFGISVPMYSYASSIFPALFGVWMLSYVYRLWDRLIRFESIKLLLVPLLSLLVTVPLTLLVLAPLGNWGSQILGAFFSWMIAVFGPFSGLIIGFLLPIMTLTGLHQSLSPIELVELTGVGYSMIIPLEFFHNLAEAGAALGTAFATKDKKLRAIATQTGFTALLGISEPALYTVMVKHRYSLLSAMIANGIGGFFGILLGVKCFAFVWPNIFSIPSFIGDDISTLAMLIICALITFAIGFILPLLFTKVGLCNERSIVVQAPIAGTYVALEEVQDEVFSKKMCGDGIAIHPSDTKIVAPCDGEIIVAMKHAVGIRLKNNSEILIHVGLDTTTIKDERMMVLVEVGMHVKKGQELITFDRDALEKDGYDLTCIVVNTSGDIQNGTHKPSLSLCDDIFTC